LRDYLYIPLGGNRSGKNRTLINLMLTMLLGGLWHGAAWTFIAWGFWHGAILIAYRVAGMETVNFARSPMMRYVHMFIMFQLVCVGWLFFRAESFSQAFDMLRALGTFTYDDYLSYGSALLAFFVVPLMIYEWRVERKAQLLYLLEAKLIEKVVVLGYCVMMLIVYPPLARQVFIYFQF
jgi:alginate O-acetyltransferase complex protein AlgI